MMAKARADNIVIHQDGTVVMPLKTFMWIQLAHLLAFLLLGPLAALGLTALILA